MTTRATEPAIIWIDHEQAIITTHDASGQGQPVVERLGRGSTEPESAFDARAVAEVKDQASVVVAGPAVARTAFERAYVAVTHRPDRLVDVEPGSDAADTGDLPARR